MSRAEGPTQCQDPHKKKNKKMAWQKNKKGVRHRRQDAHEQLKQGNLQAGREDHHKSSTLLLRLAVSDSVEEVEASAR